MLAAYEVLRLQACKHGRKTVFCMHAGREHVICMSALSCTQPPTHMTTVVLQHGAQAGTSAPRSVPITSSGCRSTGSGRQASAVHAPPTHARKSLSSCHASAPPSPCALYSLGARAASVSDCLRLPGDEGSARSNIGVALSSTHAPHPAVARRDREQQPVRLRRKLQRGHADPPAQQARQALPPLPRGRLPDRHAAVRRCRRRHITILRGRPRHLCTARCVSEPRRGVPAVLKGTSGARAQKPGCARERAGMVRPPSWRVGSTSGRRCRLARQSRLCRCRSPCACASDCTLHRQAQPQHPRGCTAQTSSHAVQYRLPSAVARRPPH